MCIRDSTGSMYYEGLSLSQRIPAAAISTNGAELLSSMLSLNPKIKFFFRQNSRNFPDVLTHTVIGEIKGSEKPDEIIVVGGHLDSWDLGDGSHDDGAGIVQSMEVLRIFKSCLLYTSPSPRDRQKSRMPSSA